MLVRDCGLALARAGEREEAKEKLQRSIGIFKKIEATGGEQPKPLHFWRAVAHYHFAGVYHHLKEDTQAIQELIDAQAVIKKARQVSPHPTVERLAKQIEARLKQLRESSSHSPP